MFIFMAQAWGYYAILYVNVLCVIKGGGLSFSWTRNDNTDTQHCTVNEQVHTQKKTHKNTHGLTLTNTHTHQLQSLQAQPKGHLFNVS